MKHKNYPIRIKIIHNTNNSIDKQYYECEIIPYSEFVRLPITLNQKTIRYPYKWYQIEWFYEMLPYQLSLRSLNGRHRNTILANDNPAKKAIIRSTMWLVLMFITVFFSEFIFKPFIQNLIDSVSFLNHLHV